MIVVNLPLCNGVVLPVGNAPFQIFKRYSPLFSEVLLNFTLTQHIQIIAYNADITSKSDPVELYFIYIGIDIGNGFTSRISKTNYMYYSPTITNQPFVRVSLSLSNKSFRLCLVDVL